MRLPSKEGDEGRLRILFLDFNSYFASVEQAEQPELRGRPIVVAPVDADTTFAIAASYPAKRFGIHTGTRISDAKKLCPDLVIVPARPRLYTHYHDRLLESVGRVLPVAKVHSIDEMSFRLLGEERTEERAKALALEMKSRIARDVSPCLTCSIGVAQNTFLSKIASEIVKPDGLTVMNGADSFHHLVKLPLLAFPGINKKMEARLRAAGIFTTEQMLQASEAQLRTAFRGVGGERWYWLLRGHEVEPENRVGQSLSHSHVLPPRLRSDQGVRSVVLRLASKAAVRLRQGDQRAGQIRVSVSGRKDWEATARLDGALDSVTISRAVERLWQHRDFEGPVKASVTFTELTKQEGHTPSLFDETAQWELLSAAMDRMNARFGKNAVYPANLHDARNTAGERIAFQKTQLLDEGADPHDWHPDQPISRDAE